MKVSQARRLKELERENGWRVRFFDGSARSKPPIDRGVSGSSVHVVDVRAGRVRLLNVAHSPGAPLRSVKEAAAMSGFYTLEGYLGSYEPGESMSTCLSGAVTAYLRRLSPGR